LLRLAVLSVLSAASRLVSLHSSFHYIVPFSAHKQAHAALKMRAKGALAVLFALPVPASVLKTATKKTINRL
jgi:hypothetical protein